MKWSKDRLVVELKRLHRAGTDLSYNALARTHQSIVSAGAYHFGSYRAAIAKTGIDYSDILRRPQWTRARIIQLIKQARRNDRDLHWSAVTKAGDELSRAAFASLQGRLFGNWDRALRAAGLDAAEISQYRRWDKSSIVFDLREMHRAGQLVNSGSLQSEDPGLHAAAVRHFGAYDAALRAAGIKPEGVRRRRTWDEPAVLAAIRAAQRGGTHLADSTIRTSHPALYGAAIRLFGTFTAARKKSGVNFKRSFG